MAKELRETQVERIIVMVDIRDLKHIHTLVNKKLYLAAIRDCVCKILLENSNKTVWAFKLFDSSMWPFRSRSYIEQTIGKRAGHVHFNPTTQTDAFLSALKSLATANFGALCCPDFVHGGRLHFISRSLLELVNDYIWDPLICLDIDSKKKDHPIPCKKNLVVLFSPFPWTRNGFRDFLKEDKPGAVLSPWSFEDDPWEQFCMKLRSAKREFESRDVHFCWIDIPPIFPAQEVIACEINPEQVIEAFKTMHWSFQTMDALLVASKLVPFQLIWPAIVYSSNMFPSVPSKTCGEVFLEIKGIDGKPVRGRVCKVQCIDLERSNSDFIQDSKACMDHLGGLDLSTVVLKNKNERRILNSSIVKLHVAELFRKDKCPDLSSVICECVMLRNLISGQKVEGIFDGIVDEMLERLQQRQCEFVRGKPVWQLLMAYLSCQKCIALVTVSDNGSHSHAILDPFTVHTAFLYILNSNVQLAITSISSTDNNVEVPYVKENADNCLQAFQENHEANSKETVTSKLYRRKRASTRYNLNQTMNSKRLKGSDLNIYKCDTWDSLYSAIVLRLCKEDPSNIELNPAIKLESRYKSNQKSKILKLVSSWFNQNSRKLGVDHNVQLKNHNEEESIEPSPVDTESIWTKGEGESYIHMDSEHVDIILSSENAVSFIGSLEEKIQHGLSNMEVDLGALANRLVQLLVQSMEIQSTEEEESHDIEKTSIFEKLMRLLLKKPEDLATKYKGCLLPLSNPQPGAFDLPPTYTSEVKVREYLFSLGFIEDICKLLENIQFNLPGGIMEGQNLIEFCDRVIKFRYVDSLYEAVEKIYEQMDLGSMDAASITSSPKDWLAGNQVNSEKSKGQKKKKLPRKTEDDYETKMKKAEMKRDRARRFSHFSSRASNLERIWTPKTPAQQKKCYTITNKFLKDDVDLKNAIQTKTEDLFRDEVDATSEMSNSTIEESVDYQVRNFVDRHDSNDDNDDDIDCIPESP
ncbi:hypothetical protein SUGI_0944820 [Cryptomeria japonica]|nr:hypothetical protein SUGI_0944820 [Cryptomeria japonica]